MRLPRQREPRRRLPLPTPLTTVALIAAVFFVLGGIGGPLVGAGTFAATDELVAHSPYYDDGFAGTPIRNFYLDDTYDAEIPGELLYADSVRSGHPAAWNPYVSAGTPLGAVPNQGLLSPLTLPYYVLPGWLAPAYQKLLETVVALLGCYLFLRRLRLRPPSALLGGIVFVSSAFMVMWTNWPQTRVAALIPWVFWAAERLAQRLRPAGSRWLPTVADAVVLALPIGFMLLGGFPAVTAFTALTAGAYTLTRIIAEHRSSWRRMLALTTATAGGLIGGLALAAVQLLPFTAFYRSWLIEGRAQQADQHLSLTALATAFAPWTFGGAGTDPAQPTWYLAPNIVEASSYVGAAALVLVLAALTMARAGRSLLPRGVWAFMVTATGAWLVLIYLGGPLALLQHLPVFSSNYIGRGRSVLGFGFAVLAATGLELLLRHRSGRVERRRHWYAGGAAVAAGALALLVLLVHDARRAAALADAAQPVVQGPTRLAYADRQLAGGIALLLVAGLAVAALWWSARRSLPRPTSTAVRLGAASVLLALVVGQALAYVGPYWPRPPRDTFYPTTDTHAYLAANLGHDRYVGTGNAMFAGLDAPKRLRALAGHTFVNAALATMLRAVPGNPLGHATHVLFDPDPHQATSPILDRLGGRYFVTSPRDGVFGTIGVTPTSGPPVTMLPDRPVTVAVPTPGPLRAVGVTPLTGGVPADSPEAWIDLTLTDPAGRTLATGRRLTAGLQPGQVFWIPITGEAIPAGTAVTATLRLHADVALALAGAAGHAAVSTITPGNDGLRLVYAGSAVVYQRLHALPRIRWGARAVVLPDEADRIKLLASGWLAPDQVVLDGPGPVAEGRPATVTVDVDQSDEIRATVRAQGGGYLVVADALQAGWAATVDGRPATLVAADQGVVAVAVGAGEHSVRLRYDPPYHGWGTWLSAAALLTAVGLLLVDLRLTRRRAAQHLAAPRTAAPHIGGLPRS